ncbi:MAG: site-specific tyrosine recombinase XerD [Chloroflexi bacterium]|nr:site-specific tyrosine recombinase XerD [Chloroflexota bacterium]
MEQSIQHFLNYLTVEKGFSANTVLAYRNDLQQFSQFVQGNIPSSQEVVPQVVGQPLITSYLGDLKERRYASSTVARKMAAVKSYFAFLVNEGSLSENPAQSLSSPRVGKYLPRTLTTDEVDCLLEQPTKRSSPESKRDRAMLELLYATGMRVTELVSLNCPHINLEMGFVHCTGKGSKERVIPIHSQAVEALKDYLETGRPQLQHSPGQEALFLNRRGERLTRQGFWLILKAYSREANIQLSVTPHVLRHSFATHMLTGDRPIDLQSLRELLGHANIATTQIYTHLTTDHLRREYEKAHPRAK